VLDGWRPIYRRWDCIWCRPGVHVCGHVLRPLLNTGHCLWRTAPLQLGMWLAVLYTFYHQRTQWNKRDWHHRGYMAPLTFAFTASNRLPHSHESVCALQLVEPSSQKFQRLRVTDDSHNIDHYHCNLTNPFSLTKRMEEFTYSMNYCSNAT